MADSLRDQLIAAGFEAPRKPDKKPVKKPADKSRAKKRRPGGRPGADSKNSSHKKSAKATTQRDSAHRQNSSDAEVLERKKLKAQIKELIDNNKIENWKGEIAYRYTVDKRIRELYVNEAAQKQLTAREVSITRLNGDTFLVPIAVATEIIKINPQWSVFNTTDAEEKRTEDDGYSEFQVPDDLQW